MESEFKLNIEENHKYNTCNFSESGMIKYDYNIKTQNSNITFNSTSVSILPPNASWSDMEGFVLRRYGPFKFNFTNAKNDTIAEIVLFISYGCNGKFNSSGHYLADATVSPYSIFANPGYHFTCNVTASDPINFGTTSDPIPGVNLKLQMQVKSYNKLILKKPYTSLENSTNLKTPLTLSKYTCHNRLNTIEQYLIVCIRGDCQAHVITAYGY